MDGCHTIAMGGRVLLESSRLWSGLLGLVLGSKAVGCGCRCRSALFVASQ